MSTPLRVLILEDRPEDAELVVHELRRSGFEPTWTRVDKAPLPARPVTQFAVDRSNWRRAFAAYAGFNAATPGRPGHVFATTDGGNTWENVTGNLPDSPVNSLILDPSNPTILYAATDVGTFVTADRGGHWAFLARGLPASTVWQLSYDPAHGQLVRKSCCKLS